VNGEDHPLEPASLLEVPAHLLHLDACRFDEREPAHSGAERDERERPGAELVRATEGARGRLPDDLGRRGAAELHRRRVDHPSRRHVAGYGLHRRAEGDRRLAVALGLHARAARTGDRAGHPSAVGQIGVGRVGDGVDLEPRDVGVQHLDCRHGNRIAISAADGRLDGRGRAPERLTS